jgi:hypothetical protein
LFRLIRHPLIIAPIGAQRQALLTERLHSTPRIATSAHSGLTTIEAVEDGWCRRCISHAMASGSQTVRLRRARAARSAETGFAPGHGGFTAAHGSAFHPCAGTGSIADFALLM